MGSMRSRQSSGPEAAEPEEEAGEEELEEEAILRPCFDNDVDVDVGKTRNETRNANREILMYM